MGNSQMLGELAQARREMQGGGEDDEVVELAAGNGKTSEEPETVVEAVETPEGEETPSVEAAPASNADDDDGEVIRIGDQEFKTQKEAIAYAEKLDREKLVSEAYGLGMREAIQANQPVVEPAPEVPFVTDEEFYSNPSEALKKVAIRAKAEALEEVGRREKSGQMWDSFLTQYPDLERKDAERILAENWNTLGKMTDVDKAMKVLAQKTRAEYQRIAERFLPRKELPAKGSQVVSSGSGSSGRVTQPRAPEKPLTMSEQMKTLRRSTR